MPIAPYGTEEYRRWNRKRMENYRRGVYGLHEYVARRERDLGAERVRVIAALEELDLEWHQPTGGRRNR